MSIQPYLFFNGRCEEAIAFYGEALGAKLSGAGGGGNDHFFHRVTSG